MQKPENTIISQYANAPVLTGLIDSFNSAVDPSGPISNFLANVWDVSTAVGPGLDIWGRIVGVTRVLSLIPAGDFGFAEGGYAPFGQGQFYSGSVLTQNYLLPDEAFRTLIMCKAMANISGCGAATINKLLALLFAGRGRCYCCDLGNMQMMIVFEFALIPVEGAILLQSGVMPRPSGVQLFILQAAQAPRWGFAEGGFAPFGIGNFSGDPSATQ